ncbi:MAG TPA: hypothetical protein VF756_06255 [Thermoanaerobaculia bacterium]
MQKRALVALVLLAVVGFGLLAGPHPCSAGQGGETDRRSPSSSSPSCHGMETEEETGDGAHARASLPSQDHDSADCCNTFCKHACQTTAVVDTEPAAFTIAAIAQAAVEASGHGLPLFAHPIDHVPLA